MEALAAALRKNGSVTLKVRAVKIDHWQLCRSLPNDRQTEVARVEIIGQVVDSVRTGSETLVVGLGMIGTENFNAQFNPQMLGQPGFLCPPNDILL
jgi:hypothetical protein